MKPFEMVLRLMTEFTENGLLVSEAACAHCGDRVQLSSDQVYATLSNFLPADIRLFVWCDQHEPTEEDIDDVKQELRENDLVLPGVTINLGMPEPVNEE